MSVPRLVAHRGYALRYPENTLEALEAALAVGACFVEFDVQLTRDGVPVLLHDADLRRTAGRAEFVFDVSSRQIAEVPVGQPQLFGDRFTNLRIPTLASAVELLAGWPRRRAFVEVKPECIAERGIDRVLERLGPDLDRAAAGQVIVISAEFAFAEAARNAGYRETGVVLRDWAQESRNRLDRLQPDYVFCNRRRIPPGVPLWSGPWRWVVYEIVDPELALELASRGVDLIETMAIGEMLADPRLAPGSCGD